MIPETIKIEILTPERRVYSGEISSARIPGVEGYFGVYPGHTPFVTTLKIGEIQIKSGKDVKYFSTGDGIAEVLPDGISILSQVCESSAEIDAKRAQAAKERAEKRLVEGRKAWDVTRAQVALMRAINRIKIASRA